MMEEQDLRRIPETAYLNAENAARYRAILHFCYRRAYADVRVSREDFPGAGTDVFFCCLYGGGAAAGAHPRG